MVKVIGYVYDGGLYHVACLPDYVDPDDSDTVGAVFSTDEAHPMGTTCDACLDYVQEPFWTVYDGGLDWPDWTGIDECLCGRPLTEDVVADNCPDCGREPWELLAEECEGCHKPVDMGGRYLLSDWGNVRHLDCQPEL